MFLNRLYPIIQAPMAGGISTPNLAAAVSNAGGLGFLAAGYKTANQVRKEIRETKQLTDQPFGVNLFVPSLIETKESVVQKYAESIEPDVMAIGAELGEIKQDDDDWENKLRVIEEESVAIVSFTFGCPTSGVIERVKQSGVYVIVSVTNPNEAILAAKAGADAICAQGVEAGGHRASFTDGEEDSKLRDLIRLIVKSVDIPVIAAGGIMGGKDILEVMECGAVAAQLGTAFLLSPESGTNPVQKEALQHSDFTQTAITRAFTGRRARGLVNKFLTNHSDTAPSAYPYIHQLTQPMRKKAGKTHKPEYMSLWAGEGYRLAENLPAAEIVRKLVEDMGSEGGQNG